MAAKTKRMTKVEVLAKLEACAVSYDEEAAHWDADRALLDFINDPEIRRAYEVIKKWYA